MTAEIVLSSALRTNLLSLQNTQKNIDKVQSVLSTGLSVSSALDNPQNFFAAESLSNRSKDLGGLLDGIGQSIQTIKTADSGAKAITKLVEQADSVIASARETLTSGATEASIIGNVDLSGIEDLTKLEGINNGDDIDFHFNDNLGVSRHVIININSGDSADQLIGKINDIKGSTGDSGYFKASLTEDGFLQIRGLKGAFKLDITADEKIPTLSPEDSALTAALGFSGIINKTTRNGGGSTASSTEITVLNSSKMTSGVFYEAGGASNGVAESSDLLTNVVTTSGGSTSRFSTSSAGDPINLSFTVNGTKTSATINAQGLTIQGLVDAINNDANIGDLVNATYDDATGKFAIEAIAPEARTINVNASTGVAGSISVNFGFGINDPLVTGAALGDAKGETFYLASAAETLDRLQNDYNNILSQIDGIVEDSGYRGINLLAGDSLTTYFNEDRSNSLTTEGVSLTTAGLGLSQAKFTNKTSVDAESDRILAAKNTLRNFGTRVSNSLSIIQTREDFTRNLVSTLDEGADKLTLADQNVEGAKLLALQTRQQLGVTALSLASQAQQSVLQLF